ncbi:MAG: hypothetical protein H7A55_20460 [Verrucomicrobiaceae bacterium]|nr:hypothetical protein [Verrucomicrobiaceae bacterium]
MTTKEFLKAFRMTPEERRIHDAAIDQDAQLAGESERPLVAEIRALGWEIDSIWDLVNYHTDHAELAPILLANLCENYHPKIKMAISGALISAKVRSEECSKALVAELQIVLGREGGQWEGVQQSLTHALAKLAHPVIAPALQALADRYQGTFLAEDLNEACKRVNRAK